MLIHKSWLITNNRVLLMGYLAFSGSHIRAYGVVVSMLDFHCSDLGSNPGCCSKISYVCDYTIEQHPWQVSVNHKPLVHPSHVREIA